MGTDYRLTSDQSFPWICAHLSRKRRTKQHLIIWREMAFILLWPFWSCWMWWWHDGIGTGIFGGLLWGFDLFWDIFCIIYLEKQQIVSCWEISTWTPPKPVAFFLPLKKWIQVAARVLWDPVFQANLGCQRSKVLIPTKHKHQANVYTSLLGCVLGLHSCRNAQLGLISCCWIFCPTVFPKIEQLVLNFLDPIGSMRCMRGLFIYLHKNKQKNHITCSQLYIPWKSGQPFKR